MQDVYLMKGYLVEDVRRKIMESLKGEVGLSGVELAKKTGINRVTLTKYLKMLETMNLVKRKSLGASNVWYLDQTMEDISNVKDILDIRKYYMYALLNLKDTKSILFNSIYSNVEPIKFIIEVIVPSLNTAYELYKRGNITASEVMLINNIALESLTLIKFNIIRDELKRGASSIFINVSEDNLISKILEVIFYIKGWNTYFIGSPSQSDPLFDIDLVRFINRIWKEDELLLICIHANKPEHIQGVKEVIIDTRAKTHGRLYMLVHGFNMEYAEIFDYYTDDLYKSIEWSEDIYKKFKG